MKYTEGIAPSTKGDKGATKHEAPAWGRGFVQKGVEPA